MKLLKMKLNEWPYPWVLVVWRDIIEDSKWMDGEDVAGQSSVEVYSTGWVREINEDEVKLGSSLAIGKERRFDESNVTVIPRGCITIIKMLRTNGDYPEV